jgi:hypothetical protein
MLCRLALPPLFQLPHLHPVLTEVPSTPGGRSKAMLDLPLPLYFTQALMGWTYNLSDQLDYVKLEPPLPCPLSPS